MIACIIAIYIYRLTVPEQPPETKTITETVYIDCVEVVVDTLEIQLPGQIDTVEVVKHFFTKKEVKSEYQDSKIKIRIKDILYMNNVEKRTLDYTLFPRKEPIKLFVKSQVYFGQNPGFSIGLSLLKNRQQYSMSYDPLNRTMFLGYNYQLKFRNPFKRKTKKS